MSLAFVHIVESPSADDLLDGRTEGRVLVEALRLAQIACWYNLAVNEDALRRALTERLCEAVRATQQQPLLHLSAHGAPQGIGLTSGEFLGWDALREMVTPINQALQGKLLLCMSACYSFEACRMAMAHQGSLPFYGLVAHTGPASWPDAALAFMTFYHHVLTKRSTIEDAVTAMRAASGDEHFYWTTAAVARQYLRTLLSAPFDASRIRPESA